MLFRVSRSWPVCALNTSQNLLPCSVLASEVIFVTAGKMFGLKVQWCKLFFHKYHLCFGFSSFGFTMTCGVAITISVTRIFIIVKVKAFLSDLSPIIVYPCCTETNLDQISSSESRPSINFKISTIHQDHDY